MFYLLCVTRWWSLWSMGATWFTSRMPPTPLCMRQTRRGRATPFATCHSMITSTSSISTGTSRRWWQESTCKLSSSSGGKPLGESCGRHNPERELRQNCEAVGSQSTWLSGPHAVPGQIDQHGENARISGQSLVLFLSQGRPVASFDPEGLIFAVGVQSEQIKLYDVRSFDKVSWQLLWFHWLLTLQQQLMPIFQGPFSTFKYPIETGCDWTGIKFSLDGKMS